MVGFNRADGDNLFLKVGLLSLSVFEKLNNMFLEGAEIFKLLEVVVYSIKVDLEIFVDKEIAQSSHWQDTVSKTLGDDIFCSNDLNCLLIIARPCPIITGNYIVANIKERLYADL